MKRKSQNILLFISPLPSNISTEGFIMGQLIGLLVMGLLLGLIVQSQGKKKQQPDLGNMGLFSCVLSSVVGGFMGLYWGLGFVTMIGFLVAINSKK
jgi:hypothetical protein